MIAPGETREIYLEVSQSYTGNPVRIPVHVESGKKPGPTVLVTAAIHGDELNGMGIIHELLFRGPLGVRRGTVVLVPVVNVFGFETQDRYMPDRRDLNRMFPGRENGSLAARVAYEFFEQVVRHSDWLVDLHTGASGRTNFPNVRARLRDPGVKQLADAFGAELVVDSDGPDGSLRREAARAGVPAIILEAGEPGKIEPTVTEVGVRGVMNVLRTLGMVDGAPVPPRFQVRVRKSTWVRAQVGGILRFHVSPGEPVDEGQPIATNVSLFAREQNVLVSPAAGLVLGMTTLPTVKPGEPVCHVAIPSTLPKTLREILAGKRAGGLAGRVRQDFARAVSVTEREEVLPPAASEED
ncbi:MAG: succinylglutamate desuccinylase/aspartoacylase family protein [bacterium]